MPNRRKRNKITRPLGSVRRGKKYVIIEESFSIDTSCFTGDKSSSLNFELHSGQWHLNHSYTSVAGRTTCHSAYATPEFKTKEDIIAYLRDFKKKISVKQKDSNKLSSALDEVINNYLL